MITKEPQTLSDAMEALSSFAELDAHADLYQLTHDLKEDHAHQEAMDWLSSFDPDQAVQVIRRLFRIVLDHVRALAAQPQGGEEREKTIRGLKMVMDVAGEAARRLDHIAVLVYGTRQGTVTHLQEYRELRAFYLKNLVRETQWLSLEKGALKDRPVTTAEVDFEEAKRDTDYELLYLHKDRGQSFLSPGLAQSIHLAVDFGSSLDFIEEDPLIHVQNWHDRFQQTAAHTMVSNISQEISTFFQRAGKGLENPLCGQLKSATTALMLAANPDNLLTNHPVKACFHYFADFQVFLRDILDSREYQRLVAYPPTDPDTWLWAAFQLLGDLLYQLYTQIEGHAEMLAIVGKIIRSGPPHAGRAYRKGHVSQQLHEDYEALQIALQRHPDGPLFKILDLLQEEEAKTLDLLHLGNLPYKICDLTVDSKKVALLRTPSPTRQEFIHDALIVEEFQSFFRHNWKEAFVMINFQDRVSWKERARSVVLEHLQEVDSAKGLLHVVTLSKDGDFYEQTGPHHKVSNAQTFAEHFAHHLQHSKACHFPEQLSHELFPSFTDQLLETVHALFFEGKNELTRPERLDFIELTYLFLELKVLDLVRPRYFSLTCKDGVDTSMGAGAALYAGLKILLEHDWRQGDRAKLWSMVFVPSLLMRERAMLPERFDRLIKVLTRLEKQVGEYAKLGMRHRLHEELAPLYDFDLFGIK